ncbi:MAG: hypothetical protein JOZ77_05085 [Candidatus Eremiobacteraeota bacterium]|nr:hypothetical protein [Candidatus Eremiobacteraeota bacterium]
MESLTRRRLSRIPIAAACTALAIATIGAAKSGRFEQGGVFALLDSSPKIVAKFWPDNVNGLRATLKVRQFTLDGKTPILNYDVDMEHIMHLVVVRDDFATFAHLHPGFDAATGTFWQDFTKEAHHRYYVYADSMPRGLGQQVFRFTLENAGAVAPSAPALTASSGMVTAGPYTVRLSQTALAANRPTNLQITILENGQPAHDLGLYLGAAAHAVFINTSTLAYVHLHPRARDEAGGAADSTREMTADGAMNMSESKAGPFLAMSVPGLPAAPYKLWIQFLGNGGTVYTAPFTLLVR